jgi:tRNA dimethylallyltransferase
MNPRFVALVGPTASGKTDLAVEAIALAGVPVEIVILDSRQLYRGIDIGTGKPDAAQRQRVPHHLLDCIDLESAPDAMDYRRRVQLAARGILDRGAVPLLVGGAGFYLRALREGFHEFEYSAGELELVRTRLASLDDEELLTELRNRDPVTADRLHPNDRYRIGRALELCELSGRRASELESAFRPQPVLDATFDVALLMPEQELLHERIGKRTALWLAGGWVAEVEALLEAGVPADAPGLGILGYRQVLGLIHGELTVEQCTTDTVVATRRYARTQRTWFRKEDPRLRFERPDPAAADALAGLLREAAASP